MSEDKKIDLAIVGATGAVGEIMLSILAERNFPVGELYPLASSRSMGKVVEFNSSQYPIKDLEGFDFSLCSLALFSAGSEVSKKYVPEAIKKKTLVVDNTSLYRQQDDVPLVISEVNPEAMDVLCKKLSKNKPLIANPNCSTMGLLVAVKPLHEAFGVKRLEVSTYQAVSGAGKQAISSLSQQSITMMKMGEIKEEDQAPFDRQIAFNLIPQIGDFEDNAYTSEEMKMVNETHKILQDNSIEVNVTCVRVPVFYGHSMTVSIEFHKKPKDAAQVLAKAPGLKYIENNQDYPTPLDGAGKDEVLVGRLRDDLWRDKSLSFWLTCDNLRKGAALNSIQIAELALEKGII